MLGLSDGMLLYHGGYCEVNHPDLAKCADDATNVTILTYLVGAYGTIGRQEADDLCIGRLIPERLKDQFCFKTETGLKCLSFVESEQIWKN